MGFVAKLKAVCRLILGHASARQGKAMRCMATRKGHEGPVTCFAISRDGQLLASAGKDTVLLWRLPEGRQPTTLASWEGQQSVSCCLAFSLLASGGMDDVVRLWTSNSLA